MPLRELSTLFKRDSRDDRRTHYAVTTTSTPSTLEPTSRNGDAWSSTDAQFTTLRFYVWTGGDPGFTLTKSGENGVFDVNTSQCLELTVATVLARKVWQAGVRPGDVLETAGGKRVDTTDVEAALVLVQMSANPSVVRFRSTASARRVRFDVLLDSDKLGVYFTGDGEHDVPVVTRIAQRQQAIRSFRSRHTSEEDVSSASGVRLGDVLVAVNGIDAITSGLSRVMAYVDTCPRPLRLTFERAANDDEDAMWAAIAVSGLSQSASERSGEQQDHVSATRSAILPALAASGAKARASASLRCRGFLRSLMSAGGTRSTSEPLQFEAQARGGHQDPQDTALEVLIEWTEGPLGLTLQEDAISGATLVNRLTGKGRAYGMERLQHGFQLYAINGERTEGRALRDLHHDLVTMPKPVRLLFRPPRCDDSSDGEDGFMHSVSSLSPSASLARMDVEALQEARLRATNLEQRYPERLASSHARNEYELLWTSRRLGLELEIPDSSDGKNAKKSSNNELKCYPTVHRVLKNCALGLTAANVGDSLVSVNHWRTSGLNKSELCEMLGSTTKPAVLCFSRRQDSSVHLVPSSLSDSLYSSYDGDSAGLRSGASYSILWDKTQGELGLLFGCYHDVDSRNALVAYVKRVGPGAARKKRLVVVGDLLVSINGQRLPKTKKQAEKMMRMLHKSTEPVVLGFRRLLVEHSGDLPVMQSNS